jgi:hypothetical protein
VREEKRVAASSAQRPSDVRAVASAAQCGARGDAAALTLEGVFSSWNSANARRMSGLACLPILRDGDRDMLRWCKVAGKNRKIQTWPKTKPCKLTQPRQSLLGGLAARDGDGHRFSACNISFFIWTAYVLPSTQLFGYIKLSYWGCELLPIEYVSMSRFLSGRYDCISLSIFSLGN